MQKEGFLTGKGLCVRARDRGEEEEEEKCGAAAAQSELVVLLCHWEEEEEEESRYSATSVLDELAIGSVLLRCSLDKERTSSDNDERDNFVVVVAAAAAAAGFAMAARALIAVAGGGNGANERMRTLLPPRSPRLRLRPCMEATISAARKMLVLQS